MTVPDQAADAAARTDEAVARLGRLASIDPGDVPRMPPLDLRLPRSRTFTVAQVQRLVRDALTNRDRTIVATLGPDLRTVLDALADAQQHIAELEAELDPGEPVTDTVQLVIPRGPILDGLNRVLRGVGWTMAGPIPLDREPIPTYVLQPLNADAEPGRETT
jgi:hypothetical protein